MKKEGDKNKINITDELESIRMTMVIMVCSEP